MRCPGCGNDELHDDTTAYFSSNKTGYVIIENVPCKKCAHCGEEYFSASVMEKIDDILAGVKNIESKIFIMNYPTAA